MKLIKASTRLKNIPDAIVDDIFYAFLNHFRWNVTKKKGTSNYYYHTNINGKWIKMHRLILPDTQFIHHKNHITHDNRLENLISCDNSINSHNRNKHRGTSKYIGVYKYNNKWRSGIGYNGKSHHIGVFKTEIEAAVAYDKKAIDAFGDNANINFPDHTLCKKERYDRNSLIKGVGLADEVDITPELTGERSESALSDLLCNIFKNKSKEK